MSPKWVSWSLNSNVSVLPARLEAEIKFQLLLCLVTQYHPKTIWHIKRIWFIFTCMASGSVGSASIVCRLIVENVWKLCVISPNISSTLSTPGPFRSVLHWVFFFRGLIFLWGGKIWDATNRTEDFRFRKRQKGSLQTKCWVCEKWWSHERSSEDQATLAYCFDFRTSVSCLLFCTSTNRTSTGPGPSASKTFSIHC